MKHIALLLTVTLLYACAPSNPGSKPLAPADKLALDVMRANGSANWPNVRTITFTFVVREGDAVKVSRKHVWDLKNGADTVTIDGKTTTVNLASANKNDPAFKAWTNDTYWLIAPLKIRDGGVMLSQKDDREIDGKKYHVLHLAFNNVGLTPGDRYHLYINPQTKMVELWDYMPKPDQTLTMTWEKYQDFNGVKLSTFHQFKGSNRSITMEDIKID